MNTIIPIGILIYLLLNYLPQQAFAGWALVSSIVIFLFMGGPLNNYFLSPAGCFLLRSTLMTDIIGITLVAVAIISHLFATRIPFFGRRPEQIPRVNLENIDWGEGSSIAAMEIS